jgi:hypothetical protein
MKTYVKILISVLAVLLMFPGKAYAYIDPATGGLLVQMLFAGIVTGVATIKLWFGKLISIFRRKPPKEGAGE